MRIPAHPTAMTCSAITFLAWSSGHYAEEVHPITPTSSGMAQEIAFTLPVYEVEEPGGGFRVTQRPVMVLQ
jgi:hypothetical protein